MGNWFFLFFYFFFFLFLHFWPKVFQLWVDHGSASRNWKDSTRERASPLHSRRRISKEMGFVTGSSCFLHSSLYQFPLPSSSSLSNSRSRNAHAKQKFRAPMACLRQENTNEGVFCNKRTVVFMGIAALPLLGLRARAIEGLATSKFEVCRVSIFMVAACYGINNTFQVWETR